MMNPQPLRSQLVIDARMFGLKHAGIGRYVQQLIYHLPKYTKDIRTTLICHPNDSPSLNGFIPANWQLFPVAARHYSLAEQYHMTRVLNHLRPELVHFPHFNYPLGYRNKFVVTIHDILWHKQKGTQVTTLPVWQYWLKYAAYRLVISRAIAQAVTIVTPSTFVKNDLIHTFKTTRSKIVPIPEGVAATYLKPHPLVGRPAHRPYLIYTGSYYPHKNVKRLIKAVKLANRTGQPVHLYLAGTRSVFQSQIASYAEHIDASRWITFLGFVSDTRLAWYYQHAAAFVFPSLSEGFGLPGLEALACGCPVIAANSTCLPEIYRRQARYFNPASTTSLLTAISATLSHPPSAAARRRYQKYAQKFSWDTTARLTAAIYHQHLTG